MNLYLIMLGKILKTENTEFLKFQYHFKSDNMLLKNDKDEILNNTGGQMLANLAKSKLLKLYPDGNFISVKLFKDKIEGAVLMNNKTSITINSQF